MTKMSIFMNIRMQDAIQQIKRRTRLKKTNHLS